MKKLFFFSLLIITSFLTLKASKLQLKVYLIDNLCPYCYSEISYLDQIPTEVDLIFIYSDDNYKVWEQILSNYELRKYELKKSKNNIITKEKSFQVFLNQ